MLSCFSEAPDPLSIVGALLVVAGTVVVARAAKPSTDTRRGDGERE